jgi:hypothetical protein
LLIITASLAAVRFCIVFSTGIAEENA